MKILRMAFLCVLLVSPFSEAFVYFLNYDNSTELTPQWIIVFGAGTDSEYPVLRDRLTNTIAASELWPKANILLTGNDITSRETEAMKEALIQRGVSEQRVSIENRSLSTWQSFAHLTVPRSSILALITSEFHQRRTLATARIFGYQALRFGADHASYEHRVFYFFRERFSCIKLVFQAIQRYVTRFATTGTMHHSDLMWAHPDELDQIRARARKPLTISSSGFLFVS